jgi:hypothetical protein
VITPSTLNFFIIGFNVLIFAFFWRMFAAKLAMKDSPFADAMAVAL